MISIYTKYVWFSLNYERSGIYAFFTQTRYNPRKIQGGNQMIKDNQKILNRLHVVIDLLILFISFALAFYLRFNAPIFENRFFSHTGVGYYHFDKYMKLLFYVLPVYLIIGYMMKLYDPKRNLSRMRQVTSIINTNALCLLCTTLIAFIEKDQFKNLAGSVTIPAFAINIVLETIFRLGLSKLLAFYRAKGMNLKHVLIVGYSYAAESYIDRIKSHPQWGYEVHGILDDTIERGTTYKGVKVLGEIDNLELILPQNRLDEIVITLSINEYGNLAHIVKMCEKSGVHTKFIPDYHNIIPTRPYTEDLDGLPVINIRHVPLSNLLNKTVKRIFDIIGALMALILASPVMLLVAILVKCSSKGPIFYSQVRVGLHNHEFKMYKFRSMAVQSESKEKKAWTVKNDPSVTKIGKIIRKTSIDELPQLFNVLKGDMSLVGPRPERPFFVEKFKEEIPRYMIKHQVRPGMTGWAQVKGYRGDTSIPKRIEHDLYYIENWTLLFDIKILFMTVFTGFVNRNAY